MVKEKKPLSNKKKTLLKKKRLEKNKKGKEKEKEKVIIFKDDNGQSYFQKNMQAISHINKEHADNRRNNLKVYKYSENNCKLQDV